MDLCSKYRPQAFKGVLGQEAVVSSLISLINRDSKLPNCLLFIGPSGIGKTTLARLCAAAIGCKGIDLIEINGANYTSVDDMRALTEMMSYRALTGSKVAIIDECQKLSDSAWNQLLKPTEEPIAGNTYILCSTDPHKIKSAMLTRATRYDLKPVPNVAILNHLKYVVEEEKFTISKQILTSIVVKSEGSPRLALKLLEKVHAETDIKKANELVNASVSNEEHPAIDLARVIARKGSWDEALTIIKSLEEDNEGIRLLIVNYINKCIFGAKSMDDTKYLLEVLNVFRGPFFPSEKMGPVLLATAILIPILED